MRVPVDGCGGRGRHQGQIGEGTEESEGADAGRYVIHRGRRRGRGRDVILQVLPVAAEAVHQLVLH